MTTVSLFTSINYQRPNSCNEQILSALSNFFYLGGARVVVIQDNQIKLESGTVSWMTVALKVAAYILFFPVTIPMLLLTEGLLWKQQFSIIKGIGHLVKMQNLEEIRKCIHVAKEKDKNWYTDIVTRNACLDAIRLDNQQIVNLFLEEGMLPDVCAGTGNGTECLPLTYFAAKEGKLSILQLLVLHGAEIKDDEQNAMRGAIEGGQSEVVKYLLESGADSNGIFKGLNRESFLGRAAFDRNALIVELLVNYGGNVERALLLNKEKYKNLSNEDQEQYTESVQLLLDYAIGANFGKELTFLNGLDVSRFNFAGIAVDGCPITRQMLNEKGLGGVEEAIITYSDIERVKEELWSAGIIARLIEKMSELGEIISDEGEINLVPLAVAAEKGFFEVVRVRLEARSDPKKVTTQISTAIVAAINNGHFEVVKLLATHPLADKQNFVAPIEMAKNKGREDIAEYLIALVGANEKNRSV